jgi:hypothetical protein
MRRLLVVVLGLAVLMAGAARAADPGAGSKTMVTGYLAPNFRIIDKGETYVPDTLNPGSGTWVQNASDMGFGMAFNRVTFSGEMEAGKIVKNVAWSVEVDVSHPTEVALQWAYIQPKFNDVLSVRFGHVKKPFSREVLHATGKLLTVDRTPATRELIDLGYANYNFGLEAVVAQPMFKITAGAYSGSPSEKSVPDQDPGLDFGGRAVVMPMDGVEIGVNAILVTLYEDGNNDGVYSDKVESNSGMAFGFDVDYKKDFGTMELWAQAELGMGDNWEEGAKEPAAMDTWKDYSWYKFQYYYLKALFMVNADLGIHFGYSAWDPNTDADAGKNNSISVITPGITYFWAKNLRTQAEVQLRTEQQGVDGDGANLDNLTYTHFVLQTVLIW